MAIALGRHQAMCTSSGGAAKQSTYEAWFALNRNAYQAVLNVAIQTEMNMTSPEVRSTGRHVAVSRRLDDVTTVHCQRFSDDKVNKSSNDSASGSPRDRAVTLASDDVIDVQQPNDFSNHDASGHEKDRTPTPSSRTITPPTLHTAGPERYTVVGLLAPERLTPPTHETSYAEQQIDTTVAWSAVDKRTLASIVNRNASGFSVTVPDPPRTQCPSDNVSWTTLVDLRCRQRSAGPDDDVSEVYCQSTPLETDEVVSYCEATSTEPSKVPDPPDATEQDGGTPPASVPKRSRKDPGHHEESEEFSGTSSSCHGLPKIRGTGVRRKQQSIDPVAAKLNKSVPGKSRKSPERLKDGAEVWKSVDKSLVEDLFDQLLRSLDEVKVSGQEVVETGSEGSSGSSSANQRTPATGQDWGGNDGGIWGSVTYKWKSNLLLRMRSQQVNKRDVSVSLGRKRRYADRKCV